MVWAWMWKHPEGLREESSEEPTSCLSYSGFSFLLYHMPFPNLLFQNFPHADDLCCLVSASKRLLCVTSAYQEEGIWHLLPVLPLFFFRLSLILFFSALPSGPRGSPRRWMRKLWLGLGKKRLRWSHVFWMLGSRWELFLLETEVVLIVSLLCNKPPWNWLALKL